MQVPGPLRAGFQLTVEMSLLVLLAPATPLKSQSVKDCQSRLDRLNASAELLDDFDVLTPVVGLTDNNWTTSTATVVEKDGSPAQLPAGYCP